MTKRSNRAVILFCLLIFLNLSHAKAFGFGNSVPIDTVYVQLKWYHQFQFAGFYAAIEKGFYEQNGLCVKLKEGFQGIQTTKEVLNGHADFGIQTSNLLLDRANGDKVMVLAAVFQHSPLVLVAQPGEKYNNPQGLANGKVMLRGDSDAELKAMLVNEHAGNFTLVDHDWVLDGFINKKVDALSCYVTDQPYELTQLGFEYNVIKPLSYGIDFYGDCIFAREDYIYKNSDLTESFLAATMMGWEYAMQNKQEIAELIINKYSDKNNLDILLYEANAMDKLLLTELVPVGSMNKGRWKHIMNTYIDLGLINKEIDLDEFVYDPEYQSAKWTKRILYVLGFAATVSLFFIFTLALFNKRLAKKVNLRTKELYRLNLELEDNIAEVNDIRQKLEHALYKAKESEQVKSAFIQNISHEIRTPLNAIIGFSNLILEDNVADDSRATIEKAIRDNNDMLLKIIEDIIDTSNIQIDEKLELKYELSNINELCKEIHVFNNHKVREDVDFEYVTNSDNSTYNICKLRVRQVINNLLSNAFKFTKTGIVTFGYEPQLTDSNLLFYVKDTGIGINNNDHEKIFDSFTQLDPLTRGTGLGLYICKSLVERMGGRIWMESEPGKGSTFYFTVKIVK